jgi:predicted MFS family arabinose efflux permease
VAGIPIARLADRGNRARLASIAIGMWGLTMMGCVFVASYVQLLCARMLAAVGEAGCKPPTYSLVGDYFPQADERTRAMSVYMAAAPLSSLVSFTSAGWLNELYGWRTTFFIIGIPGLLLAALVWLTVHEPRRDRAAAQAAPARPQVPFTEVLRVLWQRPSLRHISMVLILIYMMGTGLYPWYAAFMIRSHQMTTGTLGVWLGLIFGIGGVLGILAGGLTASRWFAGNERGQMRMNAVAVGLLVPCFVAFLTLPEQYQALAALVPLTMMLNFFLGPTYAVMQRLVGDDMRATAMSVVMLVANLVGFGLGPQIVGILSDRLMPVFGVDSLRYAMLCMSLVAFWVAYHFWKVSVTVKKDLAAAART